ncbi:MAG: hypothetical protein GJU77_01640 [Ferrovum sp.]|jgi:hypothetical protein|nr:hypothetical protein [Ferrovum sp.]NDU89288.1 hypothetical protein [Ferrovum sp.]
MANPLLNTSCGAQRARLLARLIDAGPAGVNRFQADKELNVCHLAARILALRKDGHTILTIRERAPDDEGRPHPAIARYVLTKLAKGRKS